MKHRESREERKKRFKNLSSEIAKPKVQTARIAHMKAPPSFQKIASLFINSSGDNSPIIQPFFYDSY